MILLADSFSVNIEDFLRIDLQDMVMILISTFLIVVIVKNKFWKYFRAYLDGRQQFIQSQLDEGSAKLKESEALEAQYEAQLATVKDEANEIIANANANAKAQANVIIDTAKNQAEAMKQKAAIEIEHDKSQAQAEMKQQISEVAFMAAQKVVGKELDESLHKQYVDDFIEQAGEDQWQA